MLAVYTVGDAIWTVIVLLVLVSFVGVGIWLLIHLFRNRNFLPERRGLRIVVKVVLVVFTVFVPLLGLPVLLGIWFFTRSRGGEPLDADEAEHRAPRTSSAAYGRPLPYPPPSGRKDTRA